MTCPQQVQVLLSQPGLALRLAASDPVRAHALCAQVLPLLDLVGAQAPSSNRAHPYKIKIGCYEQPDTHTHTTHSQAKFQGRRFGSMNKDAQHGTGIPAPLSAQCCN